MEPTQQRRTRGCRGGRKHRGAHQQANCPSIDSQDAGSREEISPEPQIIAELGAQLIEAWKKCKSDQNFENIIAYFENSVDDACDGQGTCVGVDLCAGSRKSSAF